MKWGDNKTPAQGTPTEKKGEFIMKDPSFIESISNRIYFYSEIERHAVLQLNKSLKEKSNESVAVMINQKISNLRLQLYINSYGGSIFSGLSAMDEIMNCTVPVDTVVDGCVASAATFLSVVGKKRYIKRNSFMLIHQLSSIMWGKFAEFQDEMKNLNRLMRTIREIYSRHTKIPQGKIDEILKHDLWFDAKTCLRYGMVDEIL